MHMYKHMHMLALSRSLTLARSLSLPLPHTHTHSLSLSPIQAKDTPKSRAGLIAFNDEVRIIGDGMREAIVLPETSLYEEV
jgi:hypothetical protein